MRNQEFFTSVPANLDSTKDKAYSTPTEAKVEINQCLDRNIFNRGPTFIILFVYIGLPFYSKAN